MSASDLRYGRQGNRWLPKETKAQVAAREATLIRTRCDCMTWLSVPSQVDQRCDTCGQPMRRVG